MALKTALAGDIKPATLDVGANHEPFPAEYQKPIPPAPRPPDLAQAQKIFAMAPPRSRISRPPKASRMAKIALPPPSSDTTLEPVLQTDSQAAQSGEPELKYQKGKAEQEAYDLLLKSNATVAKMVQGSDPSLKFKSWDAAKQERGYLLGPAEVSIGREIRKRIISGRQIGFKRSFSAKL